MSLFMFSDTHLEQVLSGEKTQTRRQWDTPRVSVGKSYRAVPKSQQGAMFISREDAPAYVLVTDLYEERLGELTPEAAAAEGGYSVEEFKAVWNEINGEWDPDEMVWVVEFEGYAEDPREQ